MLLCFHCLKAAFAQSIRKAAVGCCLVSLPPSRTGKGIGDPYPERFIRRIRFDLIEVSTTAPVVPFKSSK